MRSFFRAHKAARIKEYFAHLEYTSLIRENKLSHYHLFDIEPQMDYTSLSPDISVGGNISPMFPPFFCFKPSLSLKLGSVSV